MRFMPLLLVVGVVRAERAPHQHGDDQGEYDDFLIRTGPERGKRLENANEQSSGGRDRIADHAAENRGDKAFQADRSEEHTSELQSLMRISYAVFCLKKKHTIPN